MADFPGLIFSPRDIENIAGISYDPAKKTALFAEDFSLPAVEIASIENALLTSGFSFSLDGGFADTVFSILTAIDGGLADTVFSILTAIDGGLADVVFPLIQPIDGGRALAV
jgi:hypothetical protein